MKRRAPYLGVDRPLGVIVDEVLLPDDLIKRQTHDSFPCPTRGDPLDRARYGSAPGTAGSESRSDVYPCLPTSKDDGDRSSSWLVSYLDPL
jgi:hypothetical protein